MSIKKIYKNFLENKENNKIYYKAYWNVFKSENIGFSRLWQEECEICLSKDCIKDSGHDSDQCTECRPYTKHKVRYTQAYLEDQKPITEEIVCFTTDMQRVIVLPKLTTKKHLFLGLLVTFNETFGSKTPGKPDYCILWYEAIAGRKVTDIAPAFLQLVCQCNEDHMWLCADNCNDENKNWYLFIGLAQCAYTWGTETIIIKYQEKGHTFFLTADVINGNIRKLFRKTSFAVTFNDFAQLFEKARNNIKTIVLDLTFIYPISKKTRARS